MTRRKLPAQLVRQLPPNPANIARKLHRLRIEIIGIADSIDAALVELATKHPEIQNEASQ